MNAIPGAAAADHLGPDPGMLRTGDLLFPRALSGVGVAGSPRTGLQSEPELPAVMVALGAHPARWSGTDGGSDDDRSMLDLLRPALAPLIEHIGTATSQEVQRLLDGWSIGPAQSHGDHGVIAHDLASGRRANLVDLDDVSLQLKLLRIMSVAMPDLLQQWLAMSVTEFVRSALGRFLLHILGGGRASDAFFVGHIAMVVRSETGRLVAEDAALGDVFVIEANTTDYSHYRVALHPYRHPGTASLPSPTQRIGWMDRRAALGEKVWMGRIALPAGQEVEFRRKLSEAALSLLGRPYGFFDHPGLGDSDRLYCSEFVHESCRMAAQALHLRLPDVSDRCTWGWMLDYLHATGQRDVHALVRDLMAERRFPASRRFFVLSPAMIWNSASLAMRWSPPGQSGYAPDVP